MALAAEQHYVEVFPGSSTGTLVKRDDGSVLFSDAQLAGQWFTFMDSSPEHDNPFGLGMSFEVQCSGQTEMDTLVDSLSAVPEAEQCGWLTDRFGVSWTIVPDNMNEIMTHPGAFEALLRMKRLVIADFP